MAKPILSKIPIFNASDGTDIDFIYSGSIGSIIATISGNALNESKQYEISSYTNIIGSTIRKRFRLDSSELINSKSPYKLSILIKDGNGNESTESDMVVFYCKDKPRLLFDSLNEDSENILTSQINMFVLNYEYIENQQETLKSYKYYLYHDGTVIKESKTYYGICSHTFTVDGMQNNTTYYIQAIGESVTGYEFDTGKIELKTKFEENQNAVTINVENNYKDASVDIDTQIISIDGESANSIEYVEVNPGNYAANLLSPSDTIKYSVPQDSDYYKLYDYSLKIVVKPKFTKKCIHINSVVSTEGNSEEDAYICFCKRTFTDLYNGGSEQDSEEKVYCILETYHSPTSAIGQIYKGAIRSNYISYDSSSEWYEVNVKRIDGIYEINISQV